MEEEEVSHQPLTTQVALLRNDSKYMKEKLDHIDQQVSQNYVTKQEFDPVKRLVYGTVAAVGTLVIAAVMGLILIRGV